ncbi:hypothetical protein KIW84_UN0213 [Lathyrus oleraceus]|nr:hypothetical protein KIW84_UN0213 [Pisum sativum]
MTLSKPEDIEEEVLQFYAKLVGTKSLNLRCIDITTVRNGKTLDRESACQLIRPVEEGEVWNALKSIGQNKAPGVDGFNAYFFTATWQIVKNDVTAAVISKLVDESQSAFVPGRHIQDNIILAQELIRGSDYARDGNTSDVQDLGNGMCYHYFVSVQYQWESLKNPGSKKGIEIGRPHLPPLICAGDGIPS